MLVTFKKAKIEKIFKKVIKEKEKIYQKTEKKFKAYEIEKELKYNTFYQFIMNLEIKLWTILLDRQLKIYEVELTEKEMKYIIENL